MDKVSNGQILPVCFVSYFEVNDLFFFQKEFERLVKVCTHEDVKLPTKKQLETKAAQLIKITTQPITEVGLSALFIKCFLTQILALLPKE